MRCGMRRVCGNREPDVDVLVNLHCHSAPPRQPAAASANTIIHATQAYFLSLTFCYASLVFPVLGASKSHYMSVQMSCTASLISSSFRCRSAAAAAFTSEGM